MAALGAENRHHVVTDMLVDAAAIGLDPVNQLEVTIEQRLSLLGADLSRQTREACEVRE